jgi:hypothetical protein
MAFVRDAFCWSEDKAMSEPGFEETADTSRAEQSLPIDEEAVPSLLQEKRELEQISRRIAFGEGL